MRKKKIWGTGSVKDSVMKSAGHTAQNVFWEGASAANGDFVVFSLAWRAFFMKEHVPGLGHFPTAPLNIPTEEFCFSFGLTADEIARINFDACELSELMDDIKVTLPDPKKIQERLKARLKVMEKEGQ